MSKDKSCACTQALHDLMMAAKPNKDNLKKIQCVKCGKTVWVNRETEYCFDCEPKDDATQKA